MNIDERVRRIGWVMDELSVVRRNRRELRKSALGTAIGELDLLTELHRLLYVETPIGKTLLDLVEPEDGS